MGRFGGCWVFVWRRTWRKTAAAAEEEVILDIAKYKPQGRPGAEVRGDSRHTALKWPPPKLDEAVCNRPSSLPVPSRWLTFTETVAHSMSTESSSWPWSHCVTLGRRDAEEPREEYPSFMPSLTSCLRVALKLNQTLVWKPRPAASKVLTLCF